MKDLPARLGLSKSLCHKLIADGRIQPIRISRRCVLIAEAEIQRFLGA